jgi:hypothetical protein
MKPAHGILLALSALLMAAGASLVAVAASAAPVPETGLNGLLTLDADPYPAQNISIARGERVLWPVTAELDSPTTGQLDVRVTSEQPLAEDADALRFEFASCDEEWVLPAATTDPATCAGGAGTVVISEAAFASTGADEVWSLGAIAPGIPRYFLVTMSLPLSTPAALADEPAQVSFGFTARDVSQPARLAATGGVYAGPALLALGLLLGGATVAVAGRSRSRIARVPS